MRKRERDEFLHGFRVRRHTVDDFAWKTLVEKRRRLIQQNREQNRAKTTQKTLTSHACGSVRNQYGVAKDSLAPGPVMINLIIELLLKSIKIVKVLLQMSKNYREQVVHYYSIITPAVVTAVAQFLVMQRWKLKHNKLLSLYWGFWGLGVTRLNS